MNNISAETHSTPVKPGKEQMSMEASHASKGELIVKGVATAVAATVIIQPPQRSHVYTCQTSTGHLQYGYYRRLFDA